MMKKLMRLNNKVVTVNGSITGKLTQVGTMDVKVGNEWIMRHEIKSIELA